jgi:ribose/xylose/arabinose/galactoside ABC-type transport system permease subunit
LSASTIDESGGAGEWFWQQVLPFFTLGLLIVLLWIASPRFRDQPGDNILTVLLTSTYYVVAATGMTMVIVSGGIDLSVGSVMAFAGVVGTMTAKAVAAHYGSDPGIAAATIGILAGVVAGTMAGFINGLLIVALRIPAFIVTLGTMGIFRGLALMVSKGLAISPLPGAFSTLSGSFLHDKVPVLLIPMVIVVVVFAYLMRFTLLGRYTYAIGSNLQAAKLSGINVDAHTIKIFTIHGMLTGLSGMMLMTRLTSGQPTEGQGDELMVIAAVVIGGGSLSGGMGTVIGALIGTLIMQFLRQGCLLLHIGDFTQKIIIGVIIIAAVAFDEYRRRARG